MCGISVIVHISSINDSRKQCNCITQISEHQSSLLRKRGPDFFSNSVCVIAENAEIKFCTTVLHQRGSQLSPQPLRNSLGNILLWNGEVFSGLEITQDRNDGEELLHLLSMTKVPQNLLSIFSKIQGPWAFIYWEDLSKRLWFGRDLLGRRSLLWDVRSSQCCSLIRICSVADMELDQWEEVPADGIFCLDLKGSKVTQPLCYLWSHTSSGNLSEVKGNCHTTIFSPVHDFTKEALNADIPTTENLSDLYGINLNENSRKLPLEFLLLFQTSSVFQEAIKTFLCKMEEAVGKRIRNQPFLCKECMNLYLKCGKPMACSHSSVAVLYSGGIDSIFLAALADRCVPEGKPIDLLNVSFQHKICSGVTKNAKKQLHSQIDSVSFDSPDRISGKAGLIELQALAPLRPWNFVEINITTEELRKERVNHIQHLIAPSKTVLDDSIGCAVWFAARGQGLLRDLHGHHAPYCSPARVVLVGMGADEQLAGYSRHRTKYSTSGWKGLIEEVAMEMDRISCRNLGRDDRMISDHGREARFPFLDEDIVFYLKSLPMWLKANMEFPRGIGEKLLLRLAAASFGLTESCVLPKRAVQFGSRIAHSEDKKEKGSDVCSRLTQGLT